MTLSISCNYTWYPRQTLLISQVSLKIMWNDKWNWARWNNRFKKEHTVEDLQTQIPFASNFTLVRNLYFAYLWSPCDNDISYKQPFLFHYSPKTAIVIRWMCNYTNSITAYSCSLKANLLMVPVTKFPSGIKSWAYIFWGLNILDLFGSKCCFTKSQCSLWLIIKMNCSVLSY